MPYLVKKEVQRLNLYIQRIKILLGTYILVRMEVQFQATSLLFEYVPAFLLKI
jgi:hypothetical protein